MRVPAFSAGLRHATALTPTPHRWARRVVSSLVLAVISLALGGPHAAHAEYTCSAVATPGTDLQAFADGLQPGTIGCLRGGTHSFDGLVVRTPGITLTSYPGERATLKGRMWVDSDDVTVLRPQHRWPQPDRPSQPVGHGAGQHLPRTRRDQPPHRDLLHARPPGLGPGRRHGDRGLKDPRLRQSSRDQLRPRHLHLGRGRHHHPRQLDLRQRRSRHPALPGRQEHDDHGQRDRRQRSGHHLRRQRQGRLTAAPWSPAT